MLYIPREREIQESGRRKGESEKGKVRKERKKWGVGRPEIGRRKR